MSVPTMQSHSCSTYAERSCDPDPKALARAQQKADRAGVSVQFDKGFSDSLPYHDPDASVNRAFSSMMFHHLPVADKEKTLQEVRRVLTSDGSFHMVDFGGPDDRTTGWLAKRIHSNEHLKDNSMKRVLALMGRAGFGDSTTTGHWDFRLGLGRAYYYRATASK